VGAIPVETGPARRPLHVAIIMDGNGRWAKFRGLRRIAGHKRGAESVKCAIETALRNQIRYLTLFGFSSENWSRPVDEVKDLMGLLRYYLTDELQFLRERQIRLRIIGDRSRLAPDLVQMIDRAEAATADMAQLTLVIALSYGSRAEIAHAARRLAEQVAGGTLAPAEIDEAAVAGHLDTRGIPDPDLIIRTSGEKRISNFLLWQAAYAELVFLDTLWPDFSAHDFENALREYAKRERRYGAVGA
jgi:undecaprenyl diphosphate synthase